jgi:hypothetical protein
VADTVRIQVVLPADLEHRFREAIFKTKGMKKGNISQAFVEAVELWLKKNSTAQQPRT